MPDERTRPTGTLLAFDFGHRRIGVAVGQTLTGSANALAVVSAADKPDWQTITGIMTEWKPVAVVIGFLVTMACLLKQITQDARRFVI